MNSTMRMQPCIKPLSRKPQASIILSARFGIVEYPVGVINQPIDLGNNAREGALIGEEKAPGFANTIGMPSQGPAAETFADLASVEACHRFALRRFNTKYL